MFYNLEQIKRKLDDEALLDSSGLDDDFIDRLRLKDTSVLEENINNLEFTLQLKLPQSFKEVILKYDFGHLILGQVTFGSTEDNYVQYLKSKNVKQDNAQKHLIFYWWGEGERPKDFIMIATTDGYIILLNVKTGNIHAFSRIKRWVENELVSTNFELFLCAIGTIYLDRKTRKLALNALSIFVCSSSNCQFWKDFIEGFA